MKRMSSNLRPTLGFGTLLLVPNYSTSYSSG